VHAALTLGLAPAATACALEVLLHDLVEELRDAAPFGPCGLLEAQKSSLGPTGADGSTC
jgi:hypothetical protein